MIQTVRTLTTGGTLIGSEDVIIFNSSTSINFYLGPSYGNGREIEFKNIGTGTVTLLSNPGETVENGISLALSQHDGITLIDHVAESWVMSADVSNTVTTHPYSIELGGTAITVSDVTQTLYVDVNRTDTYTADGSMLRPYKTIQLAITRAAAITAIRVAADTYAQAVFTIDVAAGIYSANLTITKIKNLTFRLHGAYITGNIAYDSGSVGGSADNYYSRLEFIGVAGNRPEKGAAGRITGDFVGVRTNDSLAYVSFSGMDLQGHIAFNTNGTWVVAMHNTMFGPLQVNAGSPHRLSAGDLAIVLLETTGHTIITGHIAAAADGTSVTAVSLYNCDNTEFDLVNISNPAGSRITNCRFNSTTTVTASTVSIDGNSYKSMLAQTPTLTGATITLFDEWQPDPNCIYYVDENRTDKYTANGSFNRPFLTIAAALTVINADALAHQTANTYDQANYVIDVAQGTYDAALAIGNVKNLRFNLHGATISGAITYTTTMVGGSADNYYSRLEFVGCEGNRAEKGTAARLTGLFTATRNNDSLCYVSLKGVHHAGNMLFATNGTWVVSMKDVFFSGYLYTTDLAIALLETTGHTEFGAYSGIGTGHIAVPTTNAVVAVSLYNVDNTEFDLVNISNAAGSRITNCRFKSDVTITAQNIYIDANSYKSLVAQSETLTGATVVALDGALPTATGIYTTKTIKKTIGGVGVASCDFNFATAANTNEQVINLGAIVPAKARIVDVFTYTDAVFTGATTLVAETGTTSSGAELIGSTTIYATDAITAAPNAGAFIATPAAAAITIYVSATPGSNWSGVTAGKVSVYVTYIDVTGL